MDEKKYTDDGYLIVTETDRCPLWELGAESRLFVPTNDCFFCKYAEFRTQEFIRKVESVPKKGKWYSVCHNGKNRKEVIEVKK